MISTDPCVCVVAGARGRIGGPANFLARLAAAWQASGVRVVFDLEAGHYDAILVFSGTRRVLELAHRRRSGVRVVQRLNGINWIHRVHPTGPRAWLRAEALNAMMQLVRRRFADRIVYQSEFSRLWWERRFGPTDCAHTVVHNGLPLDEFSPADSMRARGPVIRIACVEANVRSGYEFGLEGAVRLRADLERALSAPVELAIAGDSDASVQRRFAHERVQWLGRLDSAGVIALDRSADLFYSCDVNASCPNAVIEALACGAPVVGYDTGALAELLPRDAGAIVAQGSDPWRLEAPRNAEALARAALDVLERGSSARAAARAVAIENFDINKVASRYATALFN